MTNTKTLGIALVAIVIAITALFTPTGKTIVQQLGSNPGPESSNTYSCVNGVCSYFERVTMKTSTTTPCIIKSPMATTSLVFATAKFTTGTTTAAVINIATSSPGVYATTTLLYAQNLPANNSREFVYRGKSGDVIFPGQLVVVGMGGYGGTFSPTGFCEAEFSGF